MSVDKTLFTLNLHKLNPVSDISNRLLAFFSAAIVFDDDNLTEKTIRKSLEFGIVREQLYEIVLQSYLFLGFPRMLQAAGVLQRIVPLEKTDDIDFLSENDLSHWYKDGVDVCKKVYKDKYEPLKQKVLAFAPEVYHWMIVEGYGKVLSRDGLSLVARELSILSFLTMENRSRQLHSHLLGAINVGASKELVKTVIEDLGLSAGEGYKTAMSILDSIKE